MVDSDIISGDKVFKILDRLKKGRTILNLHILGMGYGGLTIVTGIDGNNNGSPFFRIDRPGGWEDIVKEAEGRKAFFEFNDENRIHYKFRAIIDRLESKDIRVEFPERIERIQRRKSFRIAPPAGTNIIFDADNRYEFNVINISEGGFLISQKARFHNKSLLYIGAIMEGSYIVSQDDDKETKIGIKKAEILRIDKRKESGRYNYALKILDVEKSEKGELRKFIYDSQRRELQRRSFREA